MRQLNCGALVLINSISSNVQDAWHYVVPYLNHFGVPYTVVDLLHVPLPTNVTDYALVIIAHARFDPAGRRLSFADRQVLIQAVTAGVGLVSFDPTCPNVRDISDNSDDVLAGETSGDAIVFTGEHPITVLHDGQPILLSRPLSIPVMAASADAALLRVGGSPLLSVHTIGAGRVVRWASLRWAQTDVLGPLGGLDDVFWRSLVWAARKPFVLRGMPPVVGMRVDDVAGTGHVWNQPPLWWVHVCNRYGLKPWLGLFLYNLTPEAIMDIRALVAERNATAFPHAFGRPPRAGAFDYIATYAADALPLRSSTYDEFIYFDHEHGRPWTDDEAARGLAAVDDWHVRHGIPISKYAVPHWYEMGQNVAGHLRDRWGVEFVCKIQDIDAPLAAEQPWLPLAPFRLHEPPGACHFDTSRRSGRPVYYADFVNFGGRQFFNCVTEIRDDAGYEWAPDDDVSETVGRGVRQLRRALDSMVLPVLFTHETDYIYKISPVAWEAEIKQITAAIRNYEPVFLTMDEAVRYVRALCTSRLVSANYNTRQRELAIAFQGSTDVPIQCQVFSADSSSAKDEDSLRPLRVEVPKFTGEITIRCNPYRNL
ncbi:MAG: hypothetical protein RMN52_09090 [Anaerolineae bacterium]|nr:hypothetical protein [Candidatus Roseilinea sp.]MDW8450147.1 hypothetical protein [Anaerolineae bacterium]